MPKSLPFLFDWGGTPLIPPPAPNNLFQLDQGLQFPRVPVNLGPTVGWEYLTLYPTSIIRNNFTVNVGFSVLLCNHTAPITIQLPNIVPWVIEPGAGPHNAWEKTVWVKDVSNQASINNITIVPFGTQTIDNLPSIVMNENLQFLRLYPIFPDLTGWFVA